MVDYARAKALANRLITKNGRTMTFVQILPYTSDSSKPWRGDSAARTTPTSTLEKIVAVVEPNTNIRLGETSLIDDLLKNYQMVVMVDGEDPLDAYHEIIDDDGTRWRIEYFYKLKPGSVLICHILGLKR